MACPDHQYSSLMADPNVTNFHFSLEGLLQYNVLVVAYSSLSSDLRKCEIYLHRIRHLECSRFGNWLSFRTSTTR